MLHVFDTLRYPVSFLKRALKTVWIRIWRMSFQRKSIQVQIKRHENCRIQLASEIHKISEESTFGPLDLR